MIRRQIFTVAISGLFSVAGAVAQEGAATPPVAGQAPSASRVRPPTGTPQSRIATPENPGVSNPQPVDPRNLDQPGTTSGSIAGSMFVPATQVIGMEVRDASGQARLGQIADLLLMPSMMGTGAPIQAQGQAGATTGNAANPLTPTGDLTNQTGAHPAMQGSMMSGDCALRFALIQIDFAAADRVLILPWELLHYQGTFFILGLDQNRLQEAPSVQLNDPRLLQRQDWLNQVSSFYSGDMTRTQSRPEGLTSEVPTPQTPLTPPQAQGTPSPVPGATPQAPGAAPQPRRTPTPQARPRSN